MITLPDYCGSLFKKGRADENAREDLCWALTELQLPNIAKVAYKLIPPPVMDGGGISVMSIHPQWHARNLGTAGTKSNLTLYTTSFWKQIHKSIHELQSSLDHELWHAKTIAENPSNAGHFPFWRRLPWHGRVEELVAHYKEEAGAYSHQLQEMTSLVSDEYRKCAEENLKRYLHLVYPFDEGFVKRIYRESKRAPEVAIPEGYHDQRG
jgi:hypothetical protein